MRDVRVSVWGRDLDLQIRFDCYEEEGVLPIQEAALSSLLSNWEVVENSKESLVRYIAGDDKADIKERVIENVFKYVVPAYIYVVREQDKRVCALMCDYLFDPEHGIAIVFENEQLIEIGPQDIVL